MTTLNIGPPPPDRLVQSVDLTGLTLREVWDRFDNKDAVFEYGGCGSHEVVLEWFEKGTYND